MARSEPAEPFQSDIIRAEEALNVVMADLDLTPTREQIHSGLEIRESEILVHRECLHAMEHKHERPIPILRLVNSTRKSERDSSRDISIAPEPGACGTSPVADWIPCASYLKYRTQQWNPLLGLNPMLKP
ncbi:hypothetical protein [Microvirga calopogonii]|uniref:hypothetical protein n=1 Tax=Microvirga calopogonii TaxID=2078013 RepID=UPI0013B45A03|nr:hypothetical protein [Microvirga calopogonii]